MKNKHYSLLFVLLCINITPVIVWGQAKQNSQIMADDSVFKDKTSFQTAAQWKPTTDIRSDIAMVYGTTDRKEMTFEQRVNSWRVHGYNVQFMTGIAWGEYSDYFLGKWDGKPHYDEAQVEQNGDTVWHGRNSPYFIPTENYLKYFNEKIIKRVIDAGINAIYLEEPEFWAKSGYSDAFKNEWKKFYGQDWQPQHTSAENTYLSNKLKYHLFYNALKECFSFAKNYGKSKGRKIKCYVATHSLLNYSMWQIVSPEASLASLPEVDGYIVQTWTGTAREPNYFNGQASSRTFETAYLEYGCMRSMTIPTGRKLFFENDPVEDVRRDWSDYKKNYEATFAAQLFYPDIDNYEVMPWPDRIFDGQYYVSQNSNEKAPMPKSYSTQLLVMINALNNIQKTKEKISGTQGISILMSNSLMFQQLPTHDNGKAFENPYFSNFYETSGMFHRFPTDTRLTDPELSNFYGQALPFLLRGVPVNIVHIENTGYKKAFDDTKILLMSYANMKPAEEKYHQYLTDWVKQGGIIIYSGRDDDPFQSVAEWWNKSDKKYKCPSDDLFVKLGIGEKPKDGIYNVGKGKVCIIRQDPKEYVLQKDGDSVLRYNVEKLYQGKLVYKNSFYLQRGAYNIISVLNENINDINDSVFTIKGKLIDLFDPALPVLSERRVRPGEQAFLLNIDSVANPNKPQVLASASRNINEKINKKNYSLITKGPLNTVNVMRILLPSKPKKIAVNFADGKDVPLLKNDWDEQSKTLLLSFDNNPDDETVSINW